MLQRVLPSSCALLVLGSLPALAERAEPPAEERVALVVVIAVDQLRRDRLDASLPGGLGRLVREGRVYTDAALDHATSETCPGHVTMLTGHYPGRAGVPGNRFIDRASGERIYCVEDRSPDAAVIGADGEPRDGRSPRNLRVDTLGDWMKAARPKARVFAVSPKDRSAISLAGQRPDSAYWLDRSGRTGFTTSLYYAPELPAWVKGWNGGSPGAGFLSSLPEQWLHADAAGEPRPDVFPGESRQHGSASPHPLRARDAEEFIENVWSSPFLDLLTLRFARELVQREELGRRAQPDLLALSLSATDTVGHEYGPESLEARDALERLDAALGDFLDFLDRWLDPEPHPGRGRTRSALVVLTADHGVLPLPEWLAATGRSECPIEGGRQGLVPLALRLHWKLHRELSPFSWPCPWVHIASQLTVNRELAEQRGVPVERVVSVAERFLEAEPAIREAWTQPEIRSRDDPMARLYRHSLDPERSGDLAIQVEPTCLIDYSGTGTTHGSPYLYDRAVPLLFSGPGVVPGRISGPAAPVDIAPTLARLIGVAIPPDLDGRDLFSTEVSHPEARP
jgi:predicted AlkP superfamily pyrophosphatase or phosphodiesterase